MAARAELGRAPRNSPIRINTCPFCGNALFYLLLELSFLLGLTTASTWLSVIPPTRHRVIRHRLSSLRMPRQNSFHYPQARFCAIKTLKPPKGHVSTQSLEFQILKAPKVLPNPVPS